MGRQLRKMNSSLESKNEDLPDSPELSYQKLVEEIYPRLVESIRGRYQRNAGKSLLDVYHADRDFLSLQWEDLAFLADQRRGIVEILSDTRLSASLVNLFVISTLEFTFANNQFLRIDQTEIANLERIYQSYLGALHRILASEITTEEIRLPLEKVVSTHFQNLGANLSRFLDPGVEDAAGNSAIFQRVVCREYSPEFQLKILGIRLEEIQQPVLDLGCGKNGRLAAYLNGQGIRTLGVDRIVEEVDWLRAADWLEFAPGQAEWGTILSHMAFSNHFIFQHLYRHGHPQRYARQYMAILDGIRPGGSFFYAPGLSFMEDLLPAGRFEVTRRKIAGPARKQEAGRGEMVEDAIYSSQVFRRL
jgi:hypothetical protein